MRQCPVIRRMAAWLMVALLALIVGEPLRGHVCPIHDGPVLALLVAGAGAHGGAGHGGHDIPTSDAVPAGHPAGHASGSPSGASDDPAPSPHSCQCVGMCCAAVPVITPISAVALSVTTTLVATAVVAPAVPVAEAGNSDVVLPFAIGPPDQA